MAKTVTIQAQQKWDYCVESRRTESSLLSTLNDQGQRGWELVNVLHHKDPKGETCWTGFLKRPSTAAQAGQAAGNTATTLATAQPEEKADGLQGFDLSGEEFALKTD
jgi:hypothetical protein